MSESANGGGGGAHGSIWLQGAKAEARKVSGFVKRARACRQNLERQRRETKLNEKAIEDGLKRAGQMQTGLIWKTKALIYGLQVRLRIVALAARLRVMTMISLITLAGILWLGIRIALMLAMAGAVLYVALRMIGAVLAFAAGVGG